MISEPTVLVPGTASGQLVHTTTPISFWGGIDAATGIVIDHHHPLCGQSIAGRILAVPASRGSCTGSMVMLELLLKDCAPAGLILSHLDEVLTLGVIAAEEVFNVSIPVIMVPEPQYSQLSSASSATITENTLLLSPNNNSAEPTIQLATSPTNTTRVPEPLQTLLANPPSEALSLAAHILLRFTALLSAPTLLPISTTHIDCCIYTGPASLLFPQRLLSLSARFSVPTTLNAISIDRRRWRELYPPAPSSSTSTSSTTDSIASSTSVQEEAEKLAAAYVSMGARETFTCAPYGLKGAPGKGEQVAWGESNAVVFANSVLGARTAKYPDLLDVCVGIVGWAPAAGAHVDEGRRPSVRVRVDLPTPDNGGERGWSDAMWACVGYAVGRVASRGVPIVFGLESRKPRMADLKGFGAAFATMSSASLFHLVAVTPEAEGYMGMVEGLEEVVVDEAVVRESFGLLNTAKGEDVGLVSLGNPHFMVEEFEEMVRLCQGRKRVKGVQVIVTTNREVYEEAEKAGLVKAVEDFGAIVITDTCWCMISEPLIRPTVKNIMTNSGKYAHYGPGMTKRGVHFGSLERCIEAACSGKVVNNTLW